jgi:pimeloyl-ACP methyl ester carboxylesterase
MMLADDGLLDLGSARLEYRMIGPRPDAAPTIVMLHEGLGCVGLWGTFPDKVAAATGAGVFVYSRSGYGRSSPAKRPRPLSFMDEEALDVLPRVLASIGFQRGILLGHSDGASIATIYAGGVQDHRVRGLVLMAPHFFTEEMGLAEIRRAGEAFEAQALARRCRRRVSLLDRPLARSGFPQMGHHRGAGLHPRADPDRAGGGRSIRHAAAGRGGEGGVLLPGRDGRPCRGASLPASRRARGHA